MGPRQGNISGRRRSQRLLVPSPERGLPVAGPGVPVAGPGVPVAGRGVPVAGTGVIDKRYGKNGSDRFDSRGADDAHRHEARLSESDRPTPLPMPGKPPAGARAGIKPPDYLLSNRNDGSKSASARFAWVADFSASNCVGRSSLNLGCSKSCRAIFSAAAHSFRS
jgi:hypothetical protein